MTLSGGTIQGQSGLESIGNEGVLCIPQCSGITGASPSDCLVSYPGHSLGESYPSAEIQSVYLTAPVKRATGHSLGESYPSAKGQLVCSSAPADWDESLLGYLILKSDKNNFSIVIWIQVFLTNNLGTFIWFTVSTFW